MRRAQAQHRIELTSLLHDHIARLLRELQPPAGHQREVRTPGLGEKVRVDIDAQAGTAPALQDHGQQIGLAAAQVENLQLGVQSEQLDQDRRLGIGQRTAEAMRAMRDRGEAVRVDRSGTASRQVVHLHRGAFHARRTTARMRRRYRSDGPGALLKAGPGEAFSGDWRRLNCQDVLILDPAWTPSTPSAR